MSNDVPMDHLSTPSGTVCEENTSNHKKLFNQDSRSFLQRMLHNVNVFVFFLSVYALIYGSLVTYLIAMITNIEKRFHIPSSVSGIVIGSTEVGYLIGVLPISHYGVKAHRPRILGVCGLVISFSAFLWAAPYFIYGALPIGDPSTSSVFNESGNSELCQASLPNKPNYSYTFATVKPTSDEGDANLSVVLFFLILGGILNGIGCTPFFNIGVTFVDDHVSKVKSSAYFGLLFCVRTIAPVIGFLIGGGLAGYPEQIFEKSTISPKDPRFIGAWWFGFILLGIATAITAVPLLFFPRTLDKDVDDDSFDEEINSMEKIKPQLSKKRFSVINQEVKTHGLSAKKEAITSFLIAMKRMLTNPAIVLMTIGASVDYLIFTSYGTFLPKYLEVHFEQTASAANLYVGAVGALSAALGTLIGGYLMSRFPMSLIKLILYSTIVLTIIIGLTTIHLFLSCPPFLLAGSLGNDGQWNNSLVCNSNCSCDINQFQPICSSENQVFLSPCAAGCQQMKDLKFSSCNCFANAATNATSGFCASGCDTQFIAFVVLSFIFSFISNIAYMPFCMASLRCVHENDKSLAMALLSFLSSLLGIGGSSFFGFVIDNACLLRGDNGTGTCVLYDRTKFRYLFIGTPLLMHVPSLILFFLTYFALKINLYMQMNEVEIKKDAEKKREQNSTRI